MYGVIKVTEISLNHALGVVTHTEKIAASGTHRVIRSVTGHLAAARTSLVNAYALGLVTQDTKHMIGGVAGILTAGGTGFMYSAVADIVTALKQAMFAA